MIAKYIDTSSLKADWCSIFEVRNAATKRLYDIVHGPGFLAINNHDFRAVLNLAKATRMVKRLKRIYTFN